MFFFIGLAVVFGAVFGGYILAGGKMAPIIKAAPFEFIIIAGAAIGASLVGNSFDIFKAAMGGIGARLARLTFRGASTYEPELSRVARSVGVDPGRLKLAVFLLTAFGTGLCGALIFIQMGQVVSGQFHFATVEFAQIVL